jgi:hypothetical protein
MDQQDLRPHLRSSFSEPSGARAAVRLLKGGGGGSRSFPCLLPVFVSGPATAAFLSRPLRDLGGGSSSSLSELLLLLLSDESELSDESSESSLLLELLLSEESSESSESLDESESEEEPLAASWACTMGNVQDQKPFASSRGPRSDLSKSRSFKPRCKATRISQLQPASRARWCK